MFGNNKMWMLELKFIPPTKNEQPTNLQGCTTSHQMWTRIQTEYAELAAENGHLLMAKFCEY